ncbi:hypothetical protein [Amycolatopsis sp. CA-230715]|uniref:hypothetical protein n=1 Tax=Amycolatopsis sp. CA-230715 TaxID=2745196 RepID=UPI001C011982|nr:hypothetical protein [Amycolatopsis sp. CA-230715]
MAERPRGERSHFRANRARTGAVPLSLVTVSRWRYLVAVTVPVDSVHKGLFEEAESGWWWIFVLRTMGVSGAALTSVTRRIEFRRGAGGFIGGSCVVRTTSVPYWPVSEMYFVNSCPIVV